MAVLATKRLVCTSQLFWVGFVCLKRLYPGFDSTHGFCLEGDYLKAFVLSVSVLCSVLLDLHPAMQVGSLSLSIHYH